MRVIMDGFSGDVQTEATLDVISVITSPSWPAQGRVLRQRNEWGLTIVRPSAKMAKLTIVRKVFIFVENHFPQFMKSQKIPLRPSVRKPLVIVPKIRANW